VTAQRPELCDSLVRFAQIVVNMDTVRSQPALMPVSRCGSLPKENLMDQLQRASTSGGRVVVATLACIGLLAIAPMAAAAPTEKVTICHATGSASNPFVQITVAAAAADAHRAHQHGEDVVGVDATGCPGGEVGPPAG
jgi:hypothetical protein